jgi:hypothetical protein
MACPHNAYRRNDHYCPHSVAAAPGRAALKKLNVRPNRVVALR